MPRPNPDAKGGRLFVRLAGGTLLRCVCWPAIDECFLGQQATGAGLHSGMPGPVQQIDLAAAPGNWRFSRAEPDPDLAGLVQEYWEVAGALEPFRETLLPNACAELMVNLGPPHQLIEGDEKTAWERAWFSGLHERSLIIESHQGTHLVSARLRALGAAELLGTRAADLANTVVDLDAFLGDDGRALREAVRAADSPAARFAVLEGFLRTGRSRSAAPTFVRHAVDRIDATHGRVRVAELHEDVGVSRKHLAVTFRRWVGVPAKTYAGIRRLVWTLERLRETPVNGVDWSMLASDAGYSDQSHLTRDFRRVGAASPTEYLKRWTPDGTALLYKA
jgi:methylphosphotriester-DNA--protein-cysteine methyltransferase